MPRKARVPAFEILGFADDDEGTPLYSAPPEPSRNPAAAANDWAIEGANAVAGAAKTVSDFVSPGNFVSEGLGDFIKMGEEHQSDVTKAAKAKLAQDIEAAGGFTDEAVAFGKYVLGSPGLTLAYLAGNIALPVGAVKGAAALGRGGAAARGASAAQIAAAGTRAGTAAGAAAGGVMTGGDAAGDTYDTLTDPARRQAVLASPRAQELAAQGMNEDAIVHQVASEQARVSSWGPAAVGAAFGATGLERVLAGGKGRGRIATGLIEGLQGASEETYQGYSSGSAAQAIDPSVDPWKGAGVNFAAGGIYESVPGFVLGGHREDEKPAGPLSRAADIAAGVQAGQEAAQRQVLGLPAPPAQPASWEVVDDRPQLPGGAARLALGYEPETVEPTIMVDSRGNAARAPDEWVRDADARRAADAEMGLTPDVRAAQARRTGGMDEPGQTDATRTREQGTRTDPALLAPSTRTAGVDEGRDAGIALVPANERPSGEGDALSAGRTDHSQDEPVPGAQPEPVSALTPPAAPASVDSLDARIDAAGRDWWAGMDAAARADALKTAGVTGYTERSPWGRISKRNRARLNGARLQAEGQARADAQQATVDPQATQQFGITQTPPKRTREEAAKERKRVYREAHPFRAFLGEHGVSVDDRSDTGGERNRPVMVPFHGPLYRKNGMRLDELARRAVEAGFLTQADVDSDSDNGGVNKLSDMIRRTLAGERILPVTAVESEQEAQWRAEMDARYEAAQEAVDALTDDEINALLQLASNEDAELRNEEIDVALEPADAQEGGGSTQETAAGTEASGDSRGSAEARVESPGEVERPSFDLDRQSADDIRRQEAQRRENEAKAEREAAEQARRDAAPPAEDFTLAGSDRPADQAAARGQQELVPAAPAEQQEPSEPEGAAEAMRKHDFEAVGWNRGKGLNKNKWSAAADGISSNYYDTAEEAVADLRERIDSARRGEERETRRRETAQTVADKIRRGEQPTDAEWATIFPGWREGHRYVRQPEASWFLTEFLGVPKHNIRANIGAAAGTLTSDMGAKYPIVYPVRLAEAFGQAGAKPQRQGTKAQREAETAEAARADYFTPGNILRGYGGFDRVLEYKAPEAPGGAWSVKVEAVRKEGDEWVAVGRPQDARWHSTQPDAKELERGPVERSEPAPLYASRPVANADDIIAWARSQGFKTTLPADDLHVTVAYSRTPMVGGATGAAQPNVRVTGGKRSVEPLGDGGAVVLKFESDAMQGRWQQYRDAGASWDHEGYQPHITLTYDAAGLDLSKVEPYSGPIALGAEKQEALDVDKAEDYKGKEVATRDGQPVGRDGLTDTERESNRLDGIADELAMQVQQESSERDFAPSEIPAVIEQWAKDNKVDAGELRARVVDRLRKRLSEGRMRQVEQALSAATARAPSVAANRKPGISDFGEKIEGARKDVWASFRDKMQQASAVDIAAEPLSKSWPAPDYQALLDEGADPWAIAFMHAARDAIPTKPQKKWKVKAWVDSVRLLRNVSMGLADGRIDRARAQELLAEAEKVSRGLRDIAGRIELYQLVGHSKSLAGVRVTRGEYGMHNRIAYNPPKVIWTVEKQAAATAFSNWPRELASGDTKEQALANFKEKFDSLEISPSAKKETTFEVYSKRGENGYWVGKKVGRNPIFLAGPFETVKEARAYKDSHNAELTEKLEKSKGVPSERRDTNRPRVGEDMRGGADVTPQMFEDAFGFKGVQFGNYVEQGRRQKDLNDAYDALMDMAAILGVPPKALSLNGELGLAFGARGKGGKGAATAHYEHEQVVINLTKREGAGSLGHEWWHALDNYFSRMRSDPSGYMTEGTDVSLAAKGSDFVRPTAVRREMVLAFGEVLKAIRSTAIKARASKLDAKRTKAYWTTSPEMSARAFESFLISKLQDQGASNDYLANIVDEATWAAAEKLGFELEGSYPYPTAGEVPAIRAAFEHFFQVVETRETDSGIALHEPSARYSVHEPQRPTQQIDLPLAEGGGASSGRPGLPGPDNRARRSVVRRVEATPEVRFKTTPDPAGVYLARTELVAERHRTIHADRVTTPQEAAVALASVADYAVEHFHGLVTDKAGKPLALVGMFKGAVAETRVYVETIYAETFRVKGAANIWFTHNHPSGKAEFSGADRTLYTILRAALQGTGIEPRGFFAQTNSRGTKNPGAWVFTENGHDTIQGQVLPADAASKTAVPVVERVIVEQEPRAAITSSAVAKDAARAMQTTLGTDAPFVMLMSAQYEPIGAYPLKPGELAMLREGERAANLFRAVSTANAGASILVDPRSVLTDAELDNVAGALSVATGQSPLDALVGKNLASRLEAGAWRPPHGSFFSRREKPVSGMNAKQVESVADRVRTGWANGPQVVVVASMSDAKVPADVREAAESKRSNDEDFEAEGFFHEGTVYLVSDALDSEADVVRVLLHEAAGHYGLRGLFGDRLDSILQQIIRAKPKAVADKMAEYGLTGAEGRLLAAEEVLARMAETNPKMGFVRRAIAAIRSWLREIGFDLRLSDAEIIRDIIIPARRFVEGGGRNHSRGKMGIVPADTNAPGHTGDAQGANSGKSVVDQIAAAAEAYAEENYGVYMGLRVVPRGLTHKVGDTPPHSFAWDDGNWTDEELNGVSTIGLRDSSPESIQAALKMLGIGGPGHHGYDGLQVVLVAGDSQMAGVDRGEQIITTPVVIGAWMKASDALNAPLVPNESSAPVFDGAMFSRRAPKKLSDSIADLFASSKGFNWWHKTIGTQYEKAQRNAHFGRVFERAQNYLNDISDLANRAADLAPSILPKLNGIRDAFKKPISKKDLDAIAAPIFQGTLADADPAKGRVFTDAELRRDFKLNDAQIGLYREFRAAVDQSLDDLAKTDVLRYVGKDVSAAVRDRAHAAAGVSEAANILAGELGRLAQADPKRADALNDAARTVLEKAQRAEALMRGGYAPLMRFGRYSVYVTRGDEQVYFGMFETQREANRMARRFREDPEYAGADVSQGVMSQEAFKIFQGVSPETLELFGEVAGIEKSEIFQQYLKLTRANRSAMKRLINRKGVAGFSEDTSRVLASFITSNARAGSANLHMGAMTEAVEAVPKEQGDVKDEAVQLAEFVKGTNDPSSKLRGLLFMQYLGGSAASALVNMTQPITMTYPYLAQFVGAGRAASDLTRAIRQAVTGVGSDADLNDALKRAEREGLVSPQEIHHLYSEAGVGLSRNSAVRRATFLWGSFFSAAEQFNRRATFIAAYRIGRQRKEADPFAFAERAVVETQGIYSRANRANWARNPVGASMLTFKQFMIAYLEFLKRLPAKQQALALVVLMLAAGLDDLPFMDDLDDVIDTAAQAMGYNWNTARAKREFLTRTLGPQGAEFVLHGASALSGMPIDVSARLGLGNLIPGTGLLLGSTKDKTREVTEVLGAPGSFFQSAAEGAGKLLAGDVRGAGIEIAPLAVRNAIKGIDMYQTGMYRDSRGRRVMDVDGYDAMVKAIGFQPSQVAAAQRKAGIVVESAALVRNVKSRIAEQIAEARFERDPEKMREAREALRDWNRKNPEARIVIDESAVNRRLKAMRATRAERLVKSTPKEIRRSIAEQL